MLVNASNNAMSRLVQSIGITDTSVTVEDGTVYPETPFMISTREIVAPSGVISKPSEIMLVKTKVGNTLIVERGAEGTLAQEHLSGDWIENRFTAGTYDKLKNTLERLFIEEGAAWE